MLRRDNSQLKVLDVRIGNDMDAVHFGKSLIGNASLSNLSLWIGGGLSIEGVREIMNGLKQCKVSELYIHQEGMVDAGNDIMNGLHKVLTLQKLNWKATSNDQVGVPLTEESDYSGPGAVFESLELSGFSLCKSGMNHLNQLGFVANKSITNLRLPNCGINNAAVKLFCENWPSDSNLRILDWQRNLLRGTGVKVLFHAIPCHASLNIVKLNGNRQIGYSGLEIIGYAMKHLHLTELHVQDCVQTRTPVIYTTRSESNEPAQWSRRGFHIVYEQNEQEALEENLYHKRLEDERTHL